jgi:hypothetical protein
MFLNRATVGIAVLLSSAILISCQTLGTGEGADRNLTSQPESDPVPLTGVTTESEPESLGEPVRTTDNGRITVQFQELDGYIPNPYMGWQDWNRPDTRFEETVGYDRYNWEDLNPARGSYDWSPIERLRGQMPPGGQISWRVRTAQPDPFGPGQVMPDWVVDAGVSIYDDPDEGSEPLYSDCLFLETHGEFVDAMRERYDGDPDVAFIDIGSYGYYGEWDSAQYDSEEDTLDWHARRRIIEMYIGGSGTRPCQDADGTIRQVTYSYQGFQHTQLIMGFTPWFQDSVIYALSQRGDVGIRNDALGSVEPHHRGYRDQINWLVQRTWPNAPIAFEFAPDAYDSESLAAAESFVREMHATFVHDNFNGHGDDAEILKVLEALGYRLVLESATYPAAATVEDGLDVELNWVNRGVAPPYVSYPVVVRLTTPDGGVVTSEAIDADIREWMPDEAQRFRLSLPLPPDLAPGTYQLKVAIVDGSGETAITPASSGQDGSGQIVLGDIQIGP